MGHPAKILIFLQKEFCNVITYFQFTGFFCEDI